MRPMMEVQPGLFVPLPKSLTIGDALDMLKTPCLFVDRAGSVRFGRSLGITLWDDEKERE